MEPNRNYSAASALTGYIFQYELANMMKEHLDFSNVVMESQVHGDYGVDIAAEYRGKKVLIQCKVSPIFSMNRLEQVLKQLSVYKSSKYKIVLAFPGELSSKQKSKLSEQDWLTVWDIDELSKIFHSQIRRSQSEELKRLFEKNELFSKTEEDELLIQLNNCSKGNRHWMAYQKICANILEHLFCPNLGKPIIELSDHIRANRRDIIMANYCDEGYWKYLRGRYRADYIIVDAKNYSTKVDKGCVLQMANYLKDYGPGMFGIIALRTEPKESAIYTQREIWMAHSKLIIFINDTDFEQMLMLKKNGNNSEEVIKQKIEDFRLGL
ncbi:restriction endonuclease [Paenibacillus senegalimassiliensis]|uniref:restriction endonuclease n=1 Tax=Paenibacillus senegalimassiliensis TaxID=1737426 RepID=UPI00073ECBCA|nr:restriction endonuclease [Paenibacillus senegalimassiliensis]